MILSIAIHFIRLASPKHKKGREGKGDATDDGQVVRDEGEGAPVAPAPVPIPSPTARARDLAILRNASV